MNLWMQHKNYDIFNLWPIDDKEGIDTTGMSFLVQFNTSLSGDIESASINLEESVKPIVYTRSAKEVSNEILLSYVGEYEISGVTIKVYLKGKNDLFMMVPGQPEYTLLPIDKDKFSLKNLNGFSVQFTRNDRGEIDALLSIQPNGTFKAIKKN